MLKLNVGFSRKSGEANYGSRGASVNLELELDSGLATDPDRLNDRIRFLFALAKASVEDELSGNTGAACNGRSTNGNGRGKDSPRRATASQVRAILAVAERNGVELGDLLRARHGVSSPNELSISEASQLIDELKSGVNGAAHGGRR